MGFNMNNTIFGTGVDTPTGKANPSQAAAAALDIRKAISHMIPRDLIISELQNGNAYPLASFLGPGWGVWHDPTLTPDSYDLNEAASLLLKAGYAVSVAPPAPIAYAGSPMLGSGSVTISGHGPAANMLIMVQQSTDGGHTWTDFAPVLTDNSSNYQTSAAAPPAFGTVWYRANFTGIVPTPGIVEGIQNGTITLNEAEFQNLTTTQGEWLGGRLMWSPAAGQSQTTDPIAVSSASTDETVVGVPIAIIIIAIVGVALWMRRKKSSTRK
jgi:ABC-type transport system substrate-binding protein